MKSGYPQEPAWFNSRLRAYLRSLRCGLGISVETLTAESGYSRTSIDAWEKGYRAPDFIQLQNWVQALGYEICVKPSVEGKISADRKRDIQMELQQQ